MQASSTYVRPNDLYEAEPSYLAMQGDADNYMDIFLSSNGNLDSLNFHIGGNESLVENEGKSTDESSLKSLHSDDISSRRFSESISSEENSSVNMNRKKRTIKIEEKFNE